MDVNTTIQVNSPYLEAMVVSLEVSQVNKPQLPAVDTKVYPNFDLLKDVCFLSLF